MWIEGVRNVTQKAYRRELARMKDGEVVGQEIAQKGAMHALQFLIRDRRFTEQQIREVLDGLARQAQWITAECRRRGLPSVDDPRGN